ncbi:ABC transporter [Companilactobacillus allii]|uniref:ABC transporter n=1 Tax=Companilactobacillus allii TaxID=1847728 RepID=A0A1P8Q2U5_9LACO|nr:ABC transporter ATP-binding protein [Companilactobacillus allii]APX72178.1 ABC transporter [Companilactobacillus allii]
MYSLNNISQVKGKHQILDDINLKIDDDSIFAILGPSGGGKTTLLNILARIDIPTSGSFSSDEDQNPKGIMVFQDYRLFPHMTVFKNIAFGLKVNGEKKEDIRVKTNEIMKTMEIVELSKRYPDELSGGQQQRVALARAMVLMPKLLLMDEPFSSLDEGLRIEMLNFVKKLQHEFHLTIIFVTHYKMEAYMLSNKIAVLINGKIMQVDKPRNLELEPVNLSVAKFLGQANFVEGKFASEFTSKVYSGMVKFKGEIADKPNFLYLPYDNSIQLEKSDYLAFYGRISDKIWISKTEVRVTVEVNRVLLQFNLPMNSVEENQSYQFYFVNLPVVY